MRRQLKIGILFSQSGDYAIISKACRKGALDAIAAVNAYPNSNIELTAVERDPGGQVERYASLCQDLLTTTEVRHIVGCVTSWSRKETIPVLEKYNGTLWYPCPYEGFEASERVVYTHACPNQHLVPLIAHTTRRYGVNGYLLGSNYIWGWETNRVARELIHDAGGQVAGERYLPLGDTDVARIIEEIRASRPSFILNNLIGQSSYAFLKAYEALAKEDGGFAPQTRPVVSCNLTECEIEAIGDAAVGHLTAGPYFQSAKPSQPCRSSFEAASYAAVSMIAQIAAAEQGEGLGDLKHAFSNKVFATPMGSLQVDPYTHHTALPVLIGRIASGSIEVIDDIGLVEPDPYLSRYDRAKMFPRPALRVVS